MHGGSMPSLQTAVSTCPNCRADYDGSTGTCDRCGIIVAKYRPIPRRVQPPRAADHEVPTGSADSLWRQVWTALREAAVDVQPASSLVIAGRAMVWIGLLIWGWRLATASIASNAVGDSFLHLVNLPFHEAGHIFFSPLGRFLQVLGGSLGQLLVPAICAGAFLIQHRNPFGASVALWWLGESLLDLAPYINDARALDLMLLGGVTGKDVEDYHDWEYILRTLGLLPYDHALAACAHAAGAVTMAAALIWGAWLLRAQWRAQR